MSRHSAPVLRNIARGGLGRDQKRVAGTSRACDRVVTGEHASPLSMKAGTRCAAVSGASYPFEQWQGAASYARGPLIRFATSVVYSVLHLRSQLTRPTPMLPSSSAPGSGTVLPVTAKSSNLVTPPAFVRPTDPDVSEESYAFR
jgi:hypothetical protein